MQSTGRLAPLSGILAVTLGGIVMFLVAPPTIAAQPDTSALAKQATQADDVADRVAAIDALGEAGEDAVAATPVLIELLDAPDPIIRAHAARALGDMGEAQRQAILEALAPRIADEDPHVRREALRSWIDLKPEVDEAVPLLHKTLSESDPVIRAHVLSAMADLGAAVVPRAIEVLRTEDGRYWAALVLGEIGPDAAPATGALAAVLRDDDRPEVKREAALALASIGPDAKAAVPTLIDALDSDAPGLREAAVFALGRIGKSSSPATEKLMQFAAQEEEPLQTVSLWALARISPDNKQLLRKVIPRLVDEIVDEDPIVRTAAARALGDLEPHPEIVLPEMKRVLAGAEPEVLHRAMDALASIGPKAVPRLINALKYEQVDEKVASILGRMGPEAAPAVPELTELLERDDADARSEALFALAAIGPPAKSAVPEMTEALDDPDMNVRYAAAYALGSVGPEAMSAKPALVQKLGGADDFLATVAAWALSQIHPECPETAPNSVPKLIGALDSPAPMVRVRAIEALGCLGPLAAEATDELEKLQDDDNPAIRRAATEALQAIRKQ